MQDYSPSWVELDSLSSGSDDDIVGSSIDIFPNLPIKKKFGETVVVMKHVTKGSSQFLCPLSRLSSSPLILTLTESEYSLAGREDVVKAVKDIHIAPGSEFYPIRRSFPIKTSFFYPDRLRGEFIMLRGPSGGGKTTLLNILGTIDKCSGGTVG